jgi:two-component system sensor histidine kinase KdpD
MLSSDALLSQADKHELADTIHEEAQRMARLISKILDMARLEAGMVRLSLAWYPLEEIVGSVLTRLGTRTRAHVIATRLPRDLPLVRVDAVMLGQVLENLVENAVKYTPRGTQIEIGAELQAGGLRLWVADRGPGLPAGSEARVFDKFDRAGRTDLQNGAGLGLTICRALIEAHGGSIHAENRAGGGALFSILIPAVETVPVPLRKATA